MTMVNWPVFLATGMVKGTVAVKSEEEVAVGSAKSRPSGTLPSQPLFVHLKYCGRGTGQAGYVSLGLR